MKTPMRRFWYLNRQIDRIEAERDLRHLQVISSAANQESFKSTVETLQKTLGDIVVYEPAVTSLDMDDSTPDPEFDRVAFERLKASLRAQQRK